MSSRRKNNGVDSIARSNKEPKEWNRTIQQISLKLQHLKRNQEEVLTIGYL